MTIDSILACFDDVKRDGRPNQWKVRCPGHDDRRPSLSIGIGKLGDRAVLNCFAGCEREDVIRAAGLTKADLFFNTNGKKENQKGRPQVVRAYDYTDRHGTVLYQFVRMRDVEGKGRFRHYCPEAKDGQYIWSLGGKPDRCPCGKIEQVLYRLPETLEAVERGELVHVTEGERDAEAIRGAGGFATTNRAGAGSWRGRIWEPLRGARVRLVADQDEAGHARVYQLAGFLAGIAWSVDVVQPREGTDAADHMEAGFGLDDFLPFRYSGIVESQDWVEMIWADRTLEPDEKLILMALDRHKKKGDYPSATLLGQECGGKHRNTVQKRLKAMESAGWFHRSVRRLGGGTWDHAYERRAPGVSVDRAHPGVCNSTYDVRREEDLSIHQEVSSHIAKRDVAIINDPAVAAESRPDRTDTDGRRSAA